MARLGRLQTLVEDIDHALSGVGNTEVLEINVSYLLSKINLCTVICINLLLG